MGYLHASYTCYKALKSNTSNADLVDKLIAWMVTASFLIVAQNVLDPLLGFWFPMYYLIKLIFVAWLVAPRSKGAVLVFVRYVEPAMNELERSLRAARDGA